MEASGPGHQPSHPSSRPQQRSKVHKLLRSTDAYFTINFKSPDGAAEKILRIVMPIFTSILWRWLKNQNWTLTRSVYLAHSLHDRPKLMELCLLFVKSLTVIKVSSGGTGLILQVSPAWAQKMINNLPVLRTGRGDLHPPRAYYCIGISSHAVHHKQSFNFKSIYLHQPCWMS